MYNVTLTFVDTTTRSFSNVTKVGVFVDAINITYYGSTTTNIPETRTNVSVNPNTITNITITKS